MPPDVGIVNAPEKSPTLGDKRIADTVADARGFFAYAGYLLPERLFRTSP